MPALVACKRANRPTFEDTIILLQRESHQGPKRSRAGSARVDPSRRNNGAFRARQIGRVTLLQPKVVPTVQQHVSYEFIWIRRTCDYVQLNVHYCVLFGSRVRVRIRARIRFAANWRSVGKCVRHIGLHVLLQQAVTAAVSAASAAPALNADRRTLRLCPALRFNPCGQRPSRGIFRNLDRIFRLGGRRCFPVKAAAEPDFAARRQWRI